MLNHLIRRTQGHKVRDNQVQVINQTEQVVLLKVHQAKMENKVVNKEGILRAKASPARMVNQQAHQARVLQDPQETQSLSRFATRSSTLRNLKEVKLMSLSKPRTTCWTSLCAITTR